jgi:hypothetical protein
VFSCQHIPDYSDKKGLADWKNKKLVTKGMYQTRDDGHAKAEKHACQETVNSRLKLFAILDE